MQSEDRFSRRQILGVGTGLVGAGLLAACSQAAPSPTPRTVEVTRVVQQKVPVEITKVVEQQVVITATPAPAPKSVTVSMWWPPVYIASQDINLELEHVKSVFSDFSAKNPNIKLDPQVIPWSGWGQKLTTAIAATQWPNVLYTGPNKEWIGQGIMEPIDSFITADIKNEFPAWAWEYMTYKGKVYSWPWFSDPSPYFPVVKEVWQNAGAADYLPTDPTREWKSFDYWLEGVTKVAQSKVAGAKVWGHAQTVNGYTYWFPTEMANYSGMAQDYIDANDNVIIANDPSSAAFLNLYKKMVSDKLAPDPLSIKWADMDQFWVKKQLGCRLHWSGIMSEAKNFLDKGQAKKPWTVQIMAPPHKEGAKPVLQTGLGAYSVMKSSASDVIAASMKWSIWLTNNDPVGTYNLANRLPLRKSDLNYYQDKDPQPELLAASRIQANSIIQKTSPTNKFWPGDLFNNAWQTNIQAFFAGQKTADQALKDAQNMLNAGAKTG